MSFDDLTWLCIELPAKDTEDDYGDDDEFENDNHNATPEEQEE